MFEVVRFIVENNLLATCVVHQLLTRRDIVMQIFVKLGIALEDFQIPARGPEKNDEFQMLLFQFPNLSFFFDFVNVACDLEKQEVAPLFNGLFVE